MVHQKAVSDQCQVTHEAKFYSSVTSESGFTLVSHEKAAQRRLFSYCELVALTRNRLALAARRIW